MIKIGVAGAGAIGSVVCRSLIDGIDGFELVAVSDLDIARATLSIERPDTTIPFCSIDELIERCDWIVEALPAKQARDVALQVLAKNKTLVAISSSALLTYPEIIETAKISGRILVPSGAIAGIDAISSLAEKGIVSLKLQTTKLPTSFSGAPYIVEQKIDVHAITEPTIIFSGNALDAARAFPANVNVAATLALSSRLPPKDIQVVIIADPAARSNAHEITVDGGLSQLKFKIENLPDPNNPKSSAMTALSIVSLLRRQTASLSI